LGAKELGMWVRARRNAWPCWGRGRGLNILARIGGGTPRTKTGKTERKVDCSSVHLHGEKLKKVGTTKRYLWKKEPRGGRPKEGKLGFSQGP